MLYGYGVLNNHVPTLRATVMKGGSSIDSDATAFITAASITDATQKSAINALVIDLKGYGIWSKMKAIYPFVGGTAAQHRFNLKSPGTTAADFYLTFNGGGTHSSTGYITNQSTAYANTNFNPSTAYADDNSAHLSIYINSVIFTGNNVDMGATVSSSSQMALISNYAGTAQSSMFDSTGISTAVSGSNLLAFYLGTRTNSTTHKLFRNSTQLGTTDTTTTGTRPNLNLFLGAYNSNGSAVLLTQRSYAFSSIGDGLTDTEGANFYTAVQKYQTTLGRNN